MATRTLDLEALVLQSGSHAQNAEHAMCVMDPCIEWQGRRDENGYGWDSGGRRAHRVAWQEANGRAIPSGLIVMHLCDNPPCINPVHLRLGTIADNNRDRHAKGRSRNLFVPGDSHPARLRAGEAHWCARLSDADVEAIREARRNGATCLVLAQKYGVHHATISRISRGIWR